MRKLLGIVTAFLLFGMGADFGLRQPNLIRLPKTLQAAMDGCVQRSYENGKEEALCLVGTDKDKTITVTGVVKPSQEAWSEHYFNSYQRLGTQYAVNLTVDCPPHTVGKFHTHPVEGRFRLSDIDKDSLMENPWRVSIVGYPECDAKNCWTGIAVWTKVRKRGEQTYFETINNVEWY